MNHIILAMSGIMALGFATGSARASEDPMYLRGLAVASVPEGSGATEVSREAYAYSYDAEGRLAETVHTGASDISFNTRTTYSYDDAGRTIEQTSYQNLKGSDDPADYTEVSKCTYTYTQRGLVDERMIYNLGADNSLELNSIWRYHYTPEERTEAIEVFVPLRDTPVQRMEYTYDRDGRRTAVEQYNGSFGDLTLSTNTTYSYNPDGRIAQQINYSYFPAENRMAINAYVDYVYDADGSLRSIDEYNNTRLMLLQQKVYIYEPLDFTIDQTVWPRTYEEEFFGVQTPAYSIATRPMSGYELRGFNEFSGECELVCTYGYTYSPEPSDNAGNAIENVTLPPLTIRREGQRMLVDGMAADACMRITDPAGRIVMAGCYGAGIDLSNLAEGSVYILTSLHGSAKFIR